MDIEINTKDKLTMDCLKLQKMAFIYNALENGGTIKKKEHEQYVFTKPHENKKEVYLDSYLQRFIKSNFDINEILDN
jgi:hypothetical protein